MNKDFKKTLIGIIIFFGLCWFFLISPITKYQKKVTKVIKPWNDSLSEIVPCRCMGVLTKISTDSSGEKTQKCLGISFGCDLYFFH